MVKVFLGGTCNGSTWREDFILSLNGDIDYFNPVVDDWTHECMVEERRQRESCDYCLYVLTPKMTGVYSIAEVIDDSNKRPSKTIFSFLKKDGDNVFTLGQVRSMEQVGDVVLRNGGIVFEEVELVARYLNTVHSSKRYSFSLKTD